MKTSTLKKPSKTLYTIFFVFLLASIASCGKNTLTNVEQGYKEKILHIANGEEPRELDPLLTTGSPEHNILFALFEGLVKKHPQTLEITPAVAKRWTLSEDKTTYTFYLRKSARWSNGDPVTANDFVYAWKRSLMPKFGSEWAYMKYFIKNAEAFNTGEITDFDQVGVHALDDHTLKVKLNYPTNFFLQVLDHNSYYPVHQPTIEKFAEIDQPISPWTRPENFVGNGPFVLTRWDLNEAIETRRNTHYWDNANIFLNGVHFYPITDQQAEVRAYRSGQVHVTYSPQMAIEKIAYFKETQPESLRITPTYSIYHYEINVTKPPLNDARVRKALALSIDRKTLVEKVTKGGEPPAYSFIPPDPHGYSPQSYFTYDPEKAKALLAEAGFPNGEGFPTIDLLYNTQDNHRKVALAIQQMLKDALNINIRLSNQEWKVYLNSKRNLEHDLARAGWIADYLDPSNFIEVLYSQSGNNDTGWKNDTYDAIVEQLKSTSDQNERWILFEQANKILADEMPVIPIYNYSDLNLVSPKVKGWHDNVLHYHPYNGVSFEPSDTHEQ